MQIFTLRLVYEHDDDFYRDIEISSDSTFLQFYQAILSSVEAQSQELASFFLCDESWKKTEEITLIDMGLTDDEKSEDDDEQNPLSYKHGMPVFEMNKTTLEEKISEEQKRLVLEYNFLNPLIFYIELIKISKKDSKKKYPVCVAKAGKFDKSLFASPHLYDNFEGSTFDDEDEDDENIFDDEDSF